MLLNNSIWLQRYNYVSEKPNVFVFFRTKVSLAQSACEVKVLILKWKMNYFFLFLDSKLLVIDRFFVTLQSKVYRGKLNNNGNEKKVYS